MKITIAQLNPIVGDLAGNVEKCLTAMHQSAEDGADLVVLPEMMVPGYPPQDILLDASFIDAIQAANADLAAQSKGLPPTLVGSLVPILNAPKSAPKLHNVALLLNDGTLEIAAYKQLLPNYDVFHEKRWFQSGPASTPITIAGRSIGVFVCEDMWSAGYGLSIGQDLVAQGAEILVNLSASIYRHQTALQSRLTHARLQGAPLVYCNLVGGQDDLIFDGRSFVVDAAGEITHQLDHCAEAIQTIDFAATASMSAALNPNQELFDALVFGTREFLHKNGINNAFLGLSGGIDSALTAIIAAEAIGAENVTAIAIPSRYTDPKSTETAALLARNLGCQFETVSLDALHQAAESTLGHLLDEGTTAENIQARLRGLILMSYVNRHGGILLNTGNKTELSLGYSTLYGDMAGGLAPIGDLTKTQVYDLARWYQAQHAVIPDFILEREPSAELKPNQVDPFDYAKVSPAMEALVQANQVNGYLARSEHKRHQMCPILKVSEKAFGIGRMMPITRR